MTATFGKLEHETLTLEPGLNVIEAPNEWGKSTWCTFLIAMLYGLDTRAKTTKTALADKEKYAPWSGSPMAGRIDLNWQGKNITIERSSKGRIPMGVFRAYETVSGLAVPELTAANCGAMLLGVEQSVYRRTAFIRQADMPVTQDDALRRRLNALVTTGDETGDSDRLAAELKELKNRCRYNRSGLLPQAEAQRKELEEKIAERDALQTHSRRLKERMGEVKSWIRELENHRDTLLYAAAEADALRVAEAREIRDRAEAQMIRMEQSCSRQPSREEAEKKIRAVQAFREDFAAFQLEEAKSTSIPVPPETPAVFWGMPLEQAEKMVDQDSSRHHLLKQGRQHCIFQILAWIVILVAGFGLILGEYIAAGLVFALGMMLLILGIRRKQSVNRELSALVEKYGSEYPDAWKQLFENYKTAKKEYDRALMNYRVLRGDLDIQRTFLQKQQESLLGSQSPEKVLEIWKKVEKQWDEWERACHAFNQADRYLKTLQDMAKPAAKPPVMADLLTYSSEETEKLLTEAHLEQQRIQNRLGQYQGRMDSLGDDGALQRELQEVSSRIEKLEEIYGAVTLALDTLTSARQELQRKFAPRISGRARELLSKMTGGRYDRLTIREDLSLLTGTCQEETLHEILWRSDGTADQLYTALRLAVAEELVPDAPLVLDDAFTRFDDARLKVVLEILKETAEQKQVILFTCQSREKELLAR